MVGHGLGVLASKRDFNLGWRVELYFITVRAFLLVVHDHVCLRLIDVIEHVRNWDRGW